MENFNRIKKVIDFLEENRQNQPSLDKVSAYLGISSFHLHRIFSEWAGITPKAFLKCLTLEHAKEMLKKDYSVLDATLESGLSGPGRLHDLCVSIEAASPGEIKSGGRGLTMTAGFTNSPFGHCLVAKNERGICHLSFEPRPSQQDGQQAIQACWPNAELVWDNDFARSIATKLFVQSTIQPAERLKAYVRGTAFQVQVWRALLRLPLGHLTSYSNIATQIGSPNSSRPVGTAVGNNPIAFLIPCHRVIRRTGACGDYRWGSSRKKAIIAWESAQRNP